MRLWETFWRDSGLEIGLHLHIPALGWHESWCNLRLSFAYDSTADLRDRFRTEVLLNRRHALLQDEISVGAQFSGHYYGVGCTRAVIEVVTG